MPVPKRLFGLRGLAADAPKGVPELGPFPSKLWRTHPNHTRPTGPLGGVPAGEMEKIPKNCVETARSLNRQKESADLLTARGYRTHRLLDSTKTPRQFRHTKHSALDHRSSRALHLRATRGLESRAARQARRKRFSSVQTEAPTALSQSTLPSLVLAVRKRIMRRPGKKWPKPYMPGRVHPVAAIRTKNLHLQGGPISKELFIDRT
jgi:hypothetical protein